MPTSLAYIDNEELLRRSCPGKHNLWLTDPIEEVSTFIRIGVIELSILIMFFGEIITMNNNGSGLLPSLFM